MQAADWIALALGILTLINGWGQFWVKERLFSKSDSADDAAVNAIRSKAGVAIIAATGVTSAVGVLLLVFAVLSTDPLTRISVFVIAALTVLTVLNIFMIQSLYMLRRIAILKHQVEQASSIPRMWMFG
jgi:hypothetical protein